MIKRILVFFTLVSLLGGHQSCSLDACGANKDAFLSRYNDFMAEVKAANLSVSDAGWSKYDDRFRKYVEHCYEQFEPELTGKEKRRFWSSAMSYYYNRYGKSLGKDLFGKEEDNLETLKKRFRELFKGQ